MSRRAITIATAVLAIIPRAVASGRSITIDEALWLDRSIGFGDALTRLDLAHASATTDGLATMPGVTTMWIGTLARLVHGGDLASAGGLHLAQLGVALVTAALIGIIVRLAWNWVGPVAATVAGVLLATEPFLVAHGAVLHTDELTALFGTITVIGVARLYGHGGTPITNPTRWAILTGAAAALTILTKLSAGLYLPSLGLLVLIALVRGERRRETAIAAGAAVAVIAILWPAIWADPGNQIDLLRQSAELAETPHLTFFRGEATESPGALFYPIAIPFRMTLWFLIATVLLAPLAFLHARRQALVLGLVTIVGLAVLTASTKTFDRYALPLLPMLALLVGIGVDRVVSRGPAMRIAAGIATVGLALHSLTPSPLLYFNPMLGGPERVERTLIIGWGEGIFEALDRIRADEDGDCSAVTIVASYKTLTDRHPCARRPARGE